MIQTCATLLFLGLLVILLSTGVLTVVGADHAVRWLRGRRRAS